MAQNFRLKVWPSAAASFLDSMKPKWQKKIARERIEILFDQAEETFPEHPERANRYVELARKIAMHYRVRIPKKFKRKFCDECHSYLKPGVNCEVEVNSEQRTVDWTCEECGNTKRYPYDEG